MKQITVGFALKMREIYKVVLKRIVDTGKTEESDILFIRLYKHYFENKKLEDFEEGE